MFRRVPPEIATRRLASLGTLVSSLEMLSQSRRFAEGELLSAQLENRYPQFAERFPRLTRVLSSRTTATALYATRAAASAATLVWPQKRGVQLAGGTALAVTGAFAPLRSPYGGDGADQLQQVINVTLAATATFQDPGQGRDVALRMLALETTLCYVASGVVKLVSPVWLRGDAFEKIIRTRQYGDPRVHRLVRRYPTAGKLVSWGTVAAEVAFPLVFLLPAPAARTYLGTMAAFHVAIGQFMGLNRFVLAFGATHPAILYVIGERDRCRGTDRGSRAGRG